MGSESNGDYRVLKDIGKPYDRRKAVLDQFQETGYTPHRMTVSRLRSGERTGNELNGILLAEQRLREDDASLKNTFYLQIAESGYSNRQPQAARPYVFSSEGLAASIADDLHLTQPTVREALRAMRCDLVYAEATSAQFPKEHFQQVAQGFFQAFEKLPKGLRPPAVEAVQAAWVDGTASTFYQQLYQQMAVRSLALWTPYEVEILADFYSQQQQMGNKLTLFDRKVLTAPKEGISDKALVADVRERTAIGLDRDVITVHRNALLYGVNARKVALNGHANGANGAV
jgi:hypothetical protein